jgi:hypothetical protein
MPGLSLGLVSNLGATPADTDLVFIWDVSAGDLRVRTYAEHRAEMFAAFQQQIAAITADPLVAGEFWNDGGTIKISAG